MIEMFYPSSVMSVIKEFDIECDKKFGQCFLVDNNALDKIAAIADVKKNELVIEIGSGPANLTARLAGAAAHVLAFETDRNLFKIYDKYFSGRRDVSFYFLDFLKADIGAILNEIKKSSDAVFDKIKVVSNIPYYITSQIIEKLLYSAVEINDIYLLISSDVADRITAKPGCGDYGILTVACALKAETSKVKKISRTCFYPAPDVESSLVRLRPYNRRPEEGFNEEAFFAVVRAAFNQRRKIALSAIANNIVRISEINRYDERLLSFLKNVSLKSLFAGLFEKIGLSLTARAEEISCGSYVNITHELMLNMKNGKDVL